MQCHQYYDNCNHKVSKSTECLKVKTELEFTRQRRGEGSLFQRRPIDKIKRYDRRVLENIRKIEIRGT